jgi:hypothetical protein
LNQSKDRFKNQNRINRLGVIMRLSTEKKEKISEQVLSFLYHSFPKQLFTSEIAKDIARDEEFVKRLMFDLKEKNLVLAIKKNEDGRDFIRRIRWQLTSPAYQAYDLKAKENPQKPNTQTQIEEKENL